MLTWILYAVEGKVHFGKDKTLATIYQLFIGVQGGFFSSQDPTSIPLDA